MHALKTWNPWREMARFQNDLDRLFGRPSASQSHQWPQLNVWTGEDHAVVTMELPGINPDQLEINVTQDVLSVSGKVEHDALQEGEQFQRRERFASSFERKLKLPFAVDASHAEANYKNGVLEIRLNRPEEEKPRRLTVNAG